MAKKFDIANFLRSGFPRNHWKTQKGLPSFVQPPTPATAEMLIVRKNGLRENICRGDEPEKKTAKKERRATAKPIQPRPRQKIPFVFCGSLDSTANVLLSD